MNSIKSNTTNFHEKKGIRIGALITCFLIACGIWLYAQAIDDDINVKTYNQLPVEIVGAESFENEVGLEIHSLSVQAANISISGINRELVKYDAQSIRLIADVSSATNGVASIKAYYIDESGNRAELKNYEVTPAVVTVNVSKQIQYSVLDVSSDLDRENFTYTVDPNTMNGTFTIVGAEQEVIKINSVSFEVDYSSVKDKEGTHKIPVTAASFYAEDQTLLFHETNKNEALKYDISGIEISVTVTRADHDK